MKDKLEWIKEHYPNIKSYPPPDYMVITYLEYCIHELEMCLAALEKPPEIATLNLNRVVSQLLICHCEEFVGDSEECERRGGTLGAF